MRWQSRGVSPLWNCILPTTALLAMAGTALYIGTQVQVRRSTGREVILAGITAAPASPAKRQLTAYAALPMAFEPNRGQASRQVKYLARVAAILCF